MINIITLQIQSTSQIKASEWDWLSIVKDYVKDNSIISVETYNEYIIRSTKPPENEEDKDV